MAANTELELLITAVVGAADETAARAGCRPLLERLGGRIVECLDCSDEEPGCWSVTISRGDPGSSAHPGALSRAVRNLLRELSPECARLRVSCEPPTAWAVVDDPALVQGLIENGERLLVEAWSDGSSLPSYDGPADQEPAGQEQNGQEQADHDPARAGTAPENLDDTGSARLELLVDVVTDRRSGAEWPARALASRLARRATIVSSDEQPPVVRVALDLGARSGDPADVVADAAALLGGSGWTRVRSREHAAVKRWSVSPAPSSGIAAIELVSSVSEPDSAAPASPEAASAAPPGEQGASS